MFEETRNPKGSADQTIPTIVAVVVFVTILVLAGICGYVVSRSSAPSTGPQRPALAQILPFGNQTIIRPA
jgi:hypothetical protein